MRNSATTLILSLMCSFGFLISSFAQLPTKSELIVKKYEKDRTRGITSLNKRYIAAFQKELDLALAAKALEEANSIQSKIQSLQAEIDELSSLRSTAVSSMEQKTMKTDFLIGKTIGFPYKDSPEKLGYFSFHENGKAYWLGMKNQSVPREYKETGKAREYILTWPGRNGDSGTYLFTVSPDGKTANVIQVSINYQTEGIIEDAD